MLNERIGVAAVETVVLRDLKWFFREQPVLDWGIDAQIEIVDGKEPTGQLIAAQIKSGPSFFENVDKDTGSFVFYVKPRHADYWLRHSLPVILCLHDPDADVTYWQELSSDTLVPTTGDGLKVLVPPDNILGAASADALMELVSEDPYVSRLNELAMAVPLMQAAKEGKTVRIDVEEWINKSSGRGSMKVYLVDEHGNVEQENEWQGFIAPGWPYPRLLAHAFPWAHLAVDEDFYESALEEEWESECVTHPGGIRVEDEPYDYWLKRITRGEDLYPYSVVSGEVAQWRIIAHLGELGAAFLRVHKYLDA